MVSITDIKKSKSAPKQVQTKSLPRGVSIDVIKNNRFKKPETPSFSIPRSFSEKYTVNKSTATPSTAVDDFVKQNTSKTVLSGASTKFTDYAKTQQFKKDNITDIADVNGYIDTISYNYISSTPVAKLKEDKNNSDIGSAVIYEAVTGSPGKGTIEEIKLAAEKNRGITPKINYYTDSLKLFGNDVDNAINKFGEYEDLYKKAMIEVGNDGKLTAETDKKVKDAITTLRGTGIKAANEGERTIAEEYAMLFDNVKNGDAANYAAMKFVQGFTSGPIGQIGGLVQDAGDAGAAISGSESTSDIVHKIEKYIAENPTKKTEIQRGGNFKIALEMGVSLSDIQNYNMITTNKQMGDHIETNFGNYVDENYKKYVGGTAENIGRFAYATLMGAAMGGSSAVGNNHSGLISNIANKSGFKKTVKDLFTYTPQTVQYGLTTYASERASAAADHGFDAKDIFVAAAKGFAESTSENIGGVEDIKWFSDISAKKGLGKVVFNHFVSTGEEILEEEFNNVAQNIIDKTFVDQDKKWFGDNGVFDPQEMADTAVSSFLFGEIVGSVKLATDIASEVKSGKRYNAEAKRLLNSISKSIPEEYRPDISKDDVDSATKKIVSAQLEHLKLVDDSIADKSETNKAITGIMNSAIKSAALGGTTKQAMLDNMSEQGYTPSAVIESKTVGANLSEETARAVNEVTDKLDAAFTSAWYGSDGVAAGRVAASVYVRAAAIGDAVSALKLASDVASGKIKGKAADKALRKAAALLPGSARIDISTFVSASENAVNIINAAEGYIVSLNENTAAISQDYSEDLIDAINRAVEGKEFVVEREHRSAIIDMILNGNLDNLNTILSDQYATQLLADILGMEITEKTDLATIKRKVRDMINTYRAGQGKGFDSISAQKKRRIKDIMKRLSDLKAEKTAIDGFRNAILNGKLTKEQAVAIASDVDVFNLYARATAGRLGANPTIDDMIKAAGYVAGFDLSGDFSPYYDNGYTNTVESDTLVTGNEVGIYDPSTGTVTLNKKAPLNKKLAYRLARELLRDIDSADPAEPNDISKTKNTLGFTDDDASSHSVDENNNIETEITLDMGEIDRFDILKNKSIRLATNFKNDLYAKELKELTHKSKSKAELIIYSLAKKIEILNKPLSTPEIDFDFTISKNNGLKKSLSQQLKYGGDYSSLAKALINIDSLLANAILVEKHSDIYRDTVRANPNFESTSVLISLLDNGDSIIPIVLEIKKEKNSDIGVLYVYVGMTEIKKIGVMARASNNSPKSLTGTDSIYSLSDIFSKVNENDVEFLKYIPTKFLSDSQNKGKQKGLRRRAVKLESLRKKERSQLSEIKEVGATLEDKTNNILTYMLSHGYTMGSERDRVVKKFNPYLIEHRSRLNSSLLSEDNLNREIVSDFLTNIFTDSAAMEKLADNDLDLAVDLAERVKAYADTATDKQMKDFANEVFSNFYNLFRSEKVNSIKFGDVLKSRRENGLSYEGIIEADSKTGKFEKDAKNRFQKTKDNLSETLNDMRRDWVDYGEAVGRLAKIIEMDEKKVKKDETSLYAYYNSIRQAKASAEVMITKRAINLDGDEVGKSLVDIFKPFYEKGAIKEFDEYIQLLNNSERAKNGKAIKKGLNSEDSIYRAKLIETKHPEFIDARDNYYKFMDNLLQMRVESGLLSKEGADTIKNSNKHYAPAFFFEKESGISPYFEDSIVVSKGVKKATGGDGETMPLFQASAIVASQVVFESRLNRFLVVVENKLKEKGMVSEIDGELIVNNPEVSKFFHSITPTTNKHIRKPQNIEGVYTTPKATSELADDIKRLFDCSDNKKEISKVVREFSRLVTLHENYNAPTINSLLNDLRELGAKRNDKTIKKTDIERNMEDIAEMSSVYNVSEEKLKRTGKRPKDTFNEFFDSLGNNIHTEQFGDIALSNSSAKSEVRHGITAEKIASVEAIPDVLQKGKVIFSETKPDSDVQRIVVCAPIKIGVEPYYMGVMIQKDSRAQRLYLHNVVIEKEMSATSQADRLTNGALEERHLYITNIIQKALEVKYDKKIVSDTKAKVHSVAEPIVELCNNAVRKAKKERIEIAQKYDSEKFQNYDIDSLNNMSHSLDEQDGRHIFYYNNGIRRAAVVGDGMYEAVKHLKHISDAQRADNWVRKINTAYKKMLTSWQPDFAARNAVRDLFTANISTHRAFWIYDLYYFRTLLYDIWGRSNSKYYKEFESLGGFGGTYFDYDQFIRLEVEDTIKNKLRKGVGYVTLATPAAALNEKIEALPRLAEYIAERKKGKSKIEAMYSAAEITVNFSRAGITGKRLNATAVPFLNASIQGADKLARLFKERPARGLLLVGLNLVLLGFGTKVVNDFIHSLVGGDDDETYDQLTDYQKQNNILIPTGDGKYFKIPKGRELAALAIILDGAGEAISGEDVDWWGVIRTASEQVTPNNPLTNNLFSALSDVKNNKTWYGTDIVDQGMAKRADELQYDENTSRIAVWLGSVFKYSPQKIDYLLGQYGTYVTDVIKDATTPSKNENVVESATTLLAGAFIIDGKASNRVSSDFYGMVASLEEEKTDWRIENRVPATVACRFMNSFDKEIEQLYNEISEVNSKDLSAAESTAQIREIKTKITALMLGAMEEKEKVYEAAKNIKSKYAYEKDGTYYNDIGEELTEEAYIDIIYREVNREVFGAEYALQTYDADTYKNATEAVKNGATYDLYYDAYFDTKNIEGDYDPDKGRDKTGTARLNKWAEIDKLDASRSEKVALARTLFKIDDEEIKEAQDSGVDLYDYINFLCDTGVMSSGVNLTKKDKVLGYINRMQISRKEKDAFYLLAGYSEKTLSDAPWR